MNALRRGTVVLLTTGLGLALAACSTGADDPVTAPAPTAPGSSTGSSVPTPAVSPSPTPSPTPEPIELPGGGTEIFPDRRLVGYSGLPDAPALGRLGIGDLDERVEEIVELGQDYTAGGREPLPVLELIVTVVHAEPMADGSYRTRIPESVIQDHLDAARRHDALLLLNIQPGRVSMAEEVRQYEEWLSEPDVGVALDPEWAVGPGEVPGRVYGSITGGELDEIAGWLSDLVAEHELPEKVMLYHQLRVDIVEDPEDLGEHEGVASVVSVDGIGSPEAKVATYDAIAPTVPEGVRFGFKLFYEEDEEVGGRVMTPEEVMDLDPRPEYVLYE